MRHLILTPLYPPPRFGGIEKIVQRLAEGFVSVGDEVIVFSFDSEQSEYNTQDTIAGVSVQRITYVTTSNLLTDILSSQNQMIEAVLASQSSCSDYIVIHAHDWFVGPAALALREHLDRPLLTIFHSDKRSEYGNRIDKDRQRIHELQKQLAHGSEIIFCYSEFMRNCIAASMDIPLEQISIFTCGIDEDAFQETKSVLPARHPTLLYLGRLAPEKDVGTLIRAFALVVKHIPKSRLRIVGDGSERVALGQMVAELGLDNNITFFPFTASQERVNEELLNADVLVLPSVFEPFGLVVLEAISRRVPVIVPTLGGPAEVVRDGVTGWCFTPGSYIDLAEKILECLENPPHAAVIAAAAIEDASQRFRWTAAVSTLKDACISLMLADVVV